MSGSSSSQMRGILAVALAVAALAGQGAPAFAVETPQTCLGFVNARDTAMRALDAEAVQGQSQLDVLGALAGDRSTELKNDDLGREAAAIVSANKTAIEDIRAKATSDIEAAAGDALDSCTNRVSGPMDSISALVELSRLTYDLNAIRANALADMADVVIVAAGDLKAHAEQAEAAGGRVDKGMADDSGGAMVVAHPDVSMPPSAMAGGEDQEMVSEPRMEGDEP